MFEKQRDSRDQIDACRLLSFMQRHIWRHSANPYARQIKFLREHSRQYQFSPPPKKKQKQHKVVSWRNPPPPRPPMGSHNLTTGREIKKNKGWPAAGGGGQFTEVQRLFFFFFFRPPHTIASPVARLRRWHMFNQIKKEGGKEKKKKKRKKDRDSQQTRFPLVSRNILNFSCMIIPRSSGSTFR